MIIGLLATAALLMFAGVVRALMSGWTSAAVVDRLAPGSEQIALPRIAIPVSQMRYESQLPVVLDSMSRALFSGAGFTQAMRDAADEHASPVAEDLRQVLHEIALGQSLLDSLDRWSDRRPYDSVRLTVASMAMTLRVGGNQARAIDASAAAVRRDLEALANARMYATQSKASATALVVLPVAILFVLLLSSRAARSFMLGTPLGLVVLAAGIVLDLTGWLWMRAMIRQALA